MIRDTFNLPDPDAVSTSMGQAGIDIQLSQAARDLFPYAVECKKAETIKIWDWLKQAEDNGKKYGLIPLTCFQPEQVENVCSSRTGSSSGTDPESKQEITLAEQWHFPTGIIIKGKARGERGALETRMEDIMSSLCQYGRTKYPDFYFNPRTIVISQKLSERLK